MPGSFNTKIKLGTQDIGNILIEKSDIIDMYPSLVPAAQRPGLYVWGLNADGQLGLGDTINRNIPTFFAMNKWTAISAGYRSSYALAIYYAISWGDNFFGQLGDGTTVNKSGAVTVGTGLVGFSQISGGVNHAAAITVNSLFSGAANQLYLWGRNHYGQLGDNTRTNRLALVQTVAGGTNWKQVACGYNNTYAIKTDGTLWCWGENYSGSLGDNTMTSRSSPVQTIAGGTNWKLVVGNSVSATVGAIKTDGTLWMWGGGSRGALGDGTINNKSSPVQTTVGGTNWKQLSVGSGNHVLALKTDGTLWAWGNNFWGQLGLGDFVDRSIPTQVSFLGGTPWRKVSCGTEHTAGIKADGTLWTWGKNNYGVLGQGADDSLFRTLPFKVGNSYSWIDVKCGSYHVLAIKEEGDW